MRRVSRFLDLLGMTPCIDHGSLVVVLSVVCNPFPIESGLVLFASKCVEVDYEGVMGEFEDKLL
jgi:hypothetical protein